MKKNQKILLGVGLIGIAAYLIYKQKKPVATFVGDKKNADGRGFCSDGTPIRSCKSKSEIWDCTTKKCVPARFDPASGGYGGYGGYGGGAMVPSGSYNFPTVPNTGGAYSTPISTVPSSGGMKLRRK